MRLDVLLAERRIDLRIAHDECKRPLSPSRILDPDHGAFFRAGPLGNDVLELERGDPFAAGFDDVLYAVGDLQVAICTHDSNIVGVEITSRPKLLGSIGIFVVALRQPRRTRYDLS